MKAIIPVIIVLLFSGCSYQIRHDNLLLYPKTETQYGIIYSAYPVKQSITNEFDTIYINLNKYLSQDLSVDTRLGNVTVGILPLSNPVCDFAKRGTTTFTYVKPRIIYLVDIDHIPTNITEKYGNAPSDYYQNGFTHELTHVLTIQSNHFSDSLSMKERLAIFCSFLDFTSTPITISKETTNFLKESLKDSFTDTKINDLKKRSLKSLTIVNSYDLVIFMLYLFETNKTQMLKELVKSNNINKFIRKVNWNNENTSDFISWIKSK